MSREDSWNVTWKDIVLSCIYTPLIILQLVLFFVYNNYLGIDILAYIGLIIWALSAVFGIAPIYTFRKKGGVSEGQSYMKTTKLVDTGLYSIVRHPQYLAGFLLIVALMLTTQHWLSVIAGAIAFVTFYVDTLRVDSHLIEKFGDDYRVYMERVPRLNFLLGIIRRMRKPRG
jgi:protein-S-isoprenylcysteine O-methyltransferase Ste14